MQTKFSRIRSLTIILLIFMSVYGLVAADDRKQPEKIYNMLSESSELIFNEIEDTIFAFNNVSFELGEGQMIYCDTAVLYVDRMLVLWGDVIVEDPDYFLSADSVEYSMISSLMQAFGDRVALWSKKDSVYAVGSSALLDRRTDDFIMYDRPTLYFGYPDSANMIEVIADKAEFSSTDDKAKCEGEVVINGQDISATAGLAYMYPGGNRLELFDDPVIEREGNRIYGKTVYIETAYDKVKRIEVIDSAHAELEQATDSTGLFVDKSKLHGERMVLDFEAGELTLLTCVGQAYSWYQPSPVGRISQDENESSGDTIRFHISDNELLQVDVVGGAVGSYITTKVEVTDTVTKTVVDTIEYQAEQIHFAVIDSIITLERSAKITSGNVALEAAKVSFDTKKRIIEAWSASVDPVIPADSNRAIEFSDQYEPNEIPVLLRDGLEEFYGDYLQYSIDTEKGRIEQSKSAVQKGTYYGDEAFRANERVFYVKNGRYTPCDVNYLHFYSKNMKFIEGEKLIASPVVMYINRIPILALPYYVFPLEKGRHSGFLPFTLGNLEESDKYIRNVGYYWAASEYWDVKLAMDYYDQSSRINFNSRVNYRKRYVFDGFLTGNLTRETSYFISPVSEETNRIRWTLQGAHNHTFSPDFTIKASGSYQSDPSFFTDNSANLTERLRRTLRSEININKKFGKSVSLSGRVSHIVNLDTESRTDYLPSLSITLPRWHPFGIGKKNDEGKLQQNWFNKLILSYNPKVTNYSRRDMKIGSIQNYYDTTYVVDTTDGHVDTSLALISADTTRFRTRQEYTRIDHLPSISFPTMNIAKYLILTSSFSYSENWYNIYQTDQSDTAGIEPGRYRNFGYSTGARLSTKLYGTVMPNVAGIKGLRQVITPSISYSYTPISNRHPDVRVYAGGSAGSSVRSSTMGISLNHLYQVKIAKSEADRNIDLLSVTHSTGYNFENQERPWSSLSSRFTSNALPSISLYGSMTHSFYEPGTNNLKFTSPYLERFDFNASMNLVGQHFLFDEGGGRGSVPIGTDSAAGLAGNRNSTSGQGAAGGSGSQWRLSMTYSYSESGRGLLFRKSSFVRLNLSFNLSPQTSVRFSQNYDFERGRTINSQISFTRQLNCWTGNFYWVPIGSNRGYGFRLFVTAIPSIKIDNSQNPLSSGYFQTLR